MAALVSAEQQERIKALQASRCVYPLGVESCVTAVEADRIIANLEAAKPRLLWAS
jgi:hypothetical protein